MREYDRPADSPLTRRPAEGDVTFRQTGTDADGDENTSTGEIRADIEQTRTEMSETIDAISERLSPQHLKAQATDAVRDATVGRAEHAAEQVNERARGAGIMIWDTIKENPIPAAMAAFGLGWLWMNRSTSQSSAQPEYGYSPAYRRAGYEYRAPGYEQESGSASQMASQARERAGQTVSNVQQQAGQMAGETWQRAENLGGEAMHKAQRARGRFEQMVHDNPLAVGAAALAVGTVVGLSIPETEQENRVMGGTRDQLMDRAKETAEEVGDKARRVAGEAQKAAQHEASEQGLKR